MVSVTCICRRSIPYIRNTLPRADPMAVLYFRHGPVKNWRNASETLDISINFVSEGTLTRMLRIHVYAIVDRYA